MNSKWVVAYEVMGLAYMLAMLWLLFPALRGPILELWRQSLYRYQLGREQERIDGKPTWYQEAMIVRGRYTPLPEPPRPLNLPIL